MFIRRAHAFWFVTMAASLTAACGDDDNNAPPIADDPDAAAEARVNSTDQAPSSGPPGATSSEPDPTSSAPDPTSSGASSSGETLSTDVVDDSDGGYLPDAGSDGGGQADGGEPDGGDGVALDAGWPDGGATETWQGSWPDAGGWKLTSPAFDDGAAFDDAHTCNNKPFGEGAFPGLDWTQGPPGTKSYAVVFKDTSIIEQNDPTSINRAFHWAIWDIPANVYSLPAALGENDDEFPSQVQGARQWAIRYQFGYFPPCPNADNSVDAAAFVTDEYEYTLYALDTEIFEYPAPEDSVNNYTRTLHTALEAAALAKIALHATSSAAASEPPGPPPAREEIDFPSPRP